MHTDNYAQSVAAEVRAEMARQHFTQTALANRMTVSQAYIARRLTGKMSFAVDELDEIAQILEVPITKLLPQSAAMQKAG